jgi:hypothetical protein
MIKSVIKLICFLAFISFASTLLAIDVPLEYVKYPDKIETYFPTGRAFVKKTLESPEGNWKLPEFISSKPIYAQVKLGDEERLMILDRQKIEDEFYNRIYFDANGNKDLTDDPVIDGTLKPGPNQSYQRTRFHSVDIKIKVDRKFLPFSFIPEFFGSLSTSDKSNINEAVVEKRISLYLRANCLYKGQFVIEGKTYFVYLCDNDCDGLFDEKFELRKFERSIPGRMPIFALGDGIFLNRDEKIEADDQQVVGNWLLVKNKLFEVNISQAKEKMSLTPITKNLVPLKLAMQTEHISLYTEDEKHFLMTCEPDKQINIPKGKYRLYNYKVLKKDDQGDLWSLSARATTESPWIILDGSDDSVLKFGEPYIVTAEVPENGLIDVRGSATAKNSVFLLFAIRGRGNEDISDLSHIKGTRTNIPLSEKEGLTHRPKEPTYTILKADGKTAAQGSFEYG